MYSHCSTSFPLTHWTEGKASAAVGCWPQSVQLHIVTWSFRTQETSTLLSSRFFLYCSWIHDGMTSNAMLFRCLQILWNCSTTYKQGSKSTWLQMGFWEFGHTLWKIQPVLPNSVKPKNRRSFFLNQKSFSELVWLGLSGLARYSRIFQSWGLLEDK